jgi:RHS repeat-associated protein
MKQGGQYYWYHNDHLGTPQKLTTTSGAVAWSAKFTSFGDAQVDAASTVDNNLRFAGQYYDSETGLHYNYHRYYDPKLGRYLRADPSHEIFPPESGVPFLIPDLVDMPQDLIPYTYVKNNPIIYSDDDGLFRKQVLKCLKNPKKCRKKVCNSLNAVMHVVCDTVRSCKGSDTCKTLRGKKRQLEACIYMRKAVKMCHGRKNDPNPGGHKKQIKQVRRRIEKCDKHLVRNKCCESSK